MDPLSCLAIAGAICQFLDFGTKFTKEAFTLYEDGESSIRKKAAAGASELQDFSTKLGEHLEENAEGLTEDEKALQVLCRECKALADSLTAKLGSLNRKEKGRVWKSMAAALSNIWSKKDIEKAVDDLARYRQAIDTRMISLTRNAVSAMAQQQSTKFKCLDQETKSIVSGLTTLKSSLESDLKLQRMALAHLLERQNVVIKLNSETRTVVNIYNPRKMNYDPGMMNAAKELEITKACDQIQIEEKRLRKAVSSSLIESLFFPTIAQRFGDVAEAHHDTFGWIFEHPDEDVQGRQWDDFVKWLETGKGLYWVNGKAGSGKSTLLKLVARHGQTLEHLSVWKGEYELLITSFFFWSSGTMLQRSQEGMLRALLHDTLLKIPQLVPILFPTQWAEVYMHKLTLPDSTFRCSWNMSALMGAFEMLLEQRLIPMRLCLFVDGLDEYSGLDSEIAKLFHKAAKSAQVKICVSSRPHLVFQESFVALPQLRLEDLTKGDIKNYVVDMLEHDDRMQMRISKENDQMRELVEEIVTSASGVFLWVKLIVMDLLRGLENHDRVCQLQERLRLLPTDLEDLYEHMVFKVDKIYRAEASRFYQIVAAATEQEDDWRPALPLNIKALFLAEQDEDLVFTAKPCFLSTEMILEGIRETDLRLRSRCGGLLETQFGKLGVRDIRPDMPVSYIHRTVRDYLDSTGIRHILSDRTGGLSAGSFNANIALMRACLLHLIATETKPDNRLLGLTLMNAFITHARRAERELCEPNTELMDLFLTISNTWLKAADGTPADFALLGNNTADFAVKAGLENYLRDQLVAYNVTVDRMLLNRALCPPSRHDQFVNKEIITLLLEAGSDPNERPPGLYERREGNQSPWQNAITYLVTKFQFVPEKQRKLLLLRWHGILKLLIQNGAKVNTTCAGPIKSTKDDKANRIVLETTRTPTEAVKELYTHNPRELAGLLKLLDSKGANDPVEDEIGDQLRARNAPVVDKKPMEKTELSATVKENETSNPDFRLFPAKSFSLEDGNNSILAITAAPDLAEKAALDAKRRRDTERDESGKTPRSIFKALRRKVGKQPGLSKG